MNRRHFLQSISSAQVGASFLPSQTKPRVFIAGAGLAGLSAAYERLHFTGEHTAETSPGLEGALESGQRAASEIASAAGRETK